MSQQLIEIDAAEGRCQAYVSWPQGDGPFAPVVMYMDGPGFRPALYPMADRIAAMGCFVLLPDLFYRLAPHSGPVGREAVLPENRPRLVERVQSLTPERVVADTGRFLDYLATRAEVRAGSRAGLVGYCMGGGMVVRGAAAYPGRVAAAAAFHGARLATDAPASPHRLLGQVRAELYFGHADQDAGMPAEDIARLEAALAASGVRHRSELYAGALHGYTMADLPAYDAAAAGRHWAALEDLFGRALADP